MVDEAREVAHLALEDLVRVVVGAGDHDVHALDAARNEPDEFANDGATVKILQKVSTTCDKETVLEAERTLRAITPLFFPFVVWNN